MKIFGQRKAMAGLISLFFIITAQGKDTISCGRTFDGIQKSFSVGKYYGNESGNIWTAGGNGEISLSSPNKDTQIIKLETNADLNTVYFVDDQFGFVLGVTGKIFNTQNSGQSWIEQMTNTKEELFAISCIEKSKCWAVGKNGALISTKNGGGDWTYIKLKNSKDLYAVDFITDKIGWIVAEDAVVMKTTDGGNTWCEQIIEETSIKKTHSSNNNKWNSLEFYDENLGCIAGDNQIICTTNGGKSWNETVIDNSKENFEFIGFSLYRGNPLAFEKCGKDFISNDFGKSWIRKK